MSTLKAGTRLRSQVCTTEVIVVRPPASPVTIACGGAEMVPAAEAAGPTGAPDPAWADGTLLGKRYVSDEAGLELLCVAAGDGSLSCDRERMPVKGAKPLPASD